MTCLRLGRIIVKDRQTMKTKGIWTKKIIKNNNLMRIRTR